MKKFIVLLMTVFVMMFAAVAYAGSGVVGMVIEATFPLLIGGESAGNVIIVDGVSYLPVRDAAEKFGYDAEFKDGQVLLSRPSVSKKTTCEVRSESLAINTAGDKYPYIIRDQNLYLPISIFGKYLSYNHNSEEMFFKIPGLDIIRMQKNTEYKSGIDNYVFSGKSFINVSAIGFTHTMKDNTIWIEKL